MFHRANATQTAGSAKHASSTAARWLVAVAIGVAAPLGAENNNKPDPLGRIVGALVAPGVRITPTASPHSTFEALDPEIAADPSIRANQGVTTTTSPDGRTLLVLTSGYNYFTDAQFNTVSYDEFVFVYDITGGSPRKTQVIKVPNTFMGIAWHPSGRAFYVAGGLNDNLHVFEQQGTEWIRAGDPISLGHTTGLGIGVAPLAAGVAVNGNGTRLLVANLENDSVSLVNLEQRAKIGEIDLRPGTHSSSREGVPGGEFPLWVVIKGNDKAYVSSLRDREIVVLDLGDDQLTIKRRIHVPGNPNRMILDSEQEKLIVALDNSDSVAVIDTDDDRVRRVIDLNVPFGVSGRKIRFTGSHPNSLALSPDDSVLYVTQGGTNSVAVVPLDQKSDKGHAPYIGLIPTGWYPNSVSVSADGGYLYIVNAIGQAGPVVPDQPNQYVLQLRKAGLLSLPVPSPKELAGLTRQVLFNNGAHDGDDDRGERTMDFLRKRIKHVIYIVKENRTYDQVLGDLEKGNGDPSLVMFPQPISPNHHQLARQFVTLDNFYCAGAVSGDGWVWSTAGRTSDFTEKTIAVNYAGRGASYDYEGMTRNINVAQPTLEERRAVNPAVPDDPNLLPGTADVAALDGPGGEKGKGYIWDAVLRAGLTVRNYGFFGDWTLNYLPAGQGYPPLLREPRKEGVQVFYPAARGLMKVSDPYYREYDMDLPDFWRFKEWENEFDEYVRKGRLPNLSLIELPHDHFGQFGTALDGVNTPETQMADNDYALGLIVEKVARSPFADDTLIFVVEDDAHVDRQKGTCKLPNYVDLYYPNDHGGGARDINPNGPDWSFTRFVQDNDAALGLTVELISNSPCWKDSVIFVVEDDTQNGADHVDGHRSIFLAISPWVKKEYLSKTHISLASVFKTVNLILGLPPLNQYDAAATDLRDMFTSRPNFSPYAFQPVQFAQKVSPLWLALTRDVDFSRPDADELKLHAAIMRSEGLPRQRTAPKLR